MVDHITKIVETAQLHVTGSSPTLTIKTGFSAVHLLAATDAARNAYAVESANLQAPLGPWFDKMMRAVPVAIVMAGASLEAAANELLTDILDGSARLAIANSQRRLLAALKEDRSGNSVDKYDRIGLILGKEIDCGTAAWQDAKLLVSFRNEFMHFKPMIYSSDSESEIKKVEKGLRTRLKNSHAYKSPQIHFPYAFMTYECAKWAVESVTAFSKEYTTQIGVTDKFANPGWDFSLPAVPDTADN
jgi:hypothetical protein